MGVVEMKRLLLMVLVSLFLVACGSEEAAEVKNETKEEEVEQETERDIKVEQILKTNNLELEVKSATIEDGAISIPIWWKQWNMYDKAHLSLVAHPVVEQGGVELETISGDDELLVQKKQLTPARASMKYQLINEDEPVTVRFLDIREEIRDEVITIELE